MPFLSPDERRRLHETAVRQFMADKRPQAADPDAAVWWLPSVSEPPDAMFAKDDVKFLRSYHISPV